jgi:hypothetical protein
MLETQTMKLSPRMPLGEKVTEEKAKTTGMSIKSIGPEGTTIEFNYVSQIKGFGRYPNGRSIGTLTMVEGPNTHTSTGQGMIITEDGEMLPWHAVGIGKRVASKTKGIALVTISTRSEKYTWMNDSLYIVDLEGSADFAEFSDTGYEYK